MMQSGRSTIGQQASQARFAITACAVALAGVASLAMTSAAAQTGSAKDSTSIVPPGGQVGDAGTGNSAAVTQIGHRQDPARPSDQITPVVDRGQTRQLAPARDRVAVAPQANRDRRAAPATPQIYRGGATAQAPDALSRPAEGRTQSVVRLSGRDSCDPQATGAGRAGCATVIETRSAEFQRSDPLILSPEQRLLIDQRLRDTPAGSQAALQRVGRNEVNPDTADAQTLASLMLTPTPADSAVGSAAASASATDATASTLEIVIQALNQGALGLTTPKR